MTRRKDTPPAPDPRRGRNPGYAEPQPRDKGEARHSGDEDDRGPPPGPESRDPDEGGLERDPTPEP